MRIYADHAATTKMAEPVIETVTECMRNVYGNPSSLHGEGQRAAAYLAAAREDIAGVLGAEPKEIIFTSGGSEADNQAIRSAARWGRGRGKRHLVSTVFEHHAVLHTLKELEKEGFEVTLLPVHEDGIVRAEALDGLPAHKMHCSVLAEEAVRVAVKDYYDKKGIAYDAGDFC